MAKAKEKVTLGGVRKPVPAAPPDLESRMLGPETPPSILRRRSDPKVVVTFQLEWSLDEELEERTRALGIKKRDIIARGIRLALDSDEFKK